MCAPGCKHPRGLSLSCSGCTQRGTLHNCVMLGFVLLAAVVHHLARAAPDLVCSQLSAHGAPKQLTLQHPCAPLLAFLQRQAKSAKRSGSALGDRPILDEEFDNGGVPVVAGNGEGARGPMLRFAIAAAFTTAFRDCVHAAAGTTRRGVSYVPCHGPKAGSPCASLEHQSHEHNVTLSAGNDQGSPKMPHCVDARPALNENLRKLHSAFLGREH